jgi:hypothetical protein
LDWVAYLGPGDACDASTGLGLAPILFRHRYVMAVFTGAIATFRKVISRAFGMIPIS